MHPALVIDLAEVFTTVKNWERTIRYEHTAIHAGTDDVSAEVLRLTKLVGYMLRDEVVSEGKTTAAFLQKPGSRIELVLTSVPEHVAYAVRTRAQFESLYNLIVEQHSHKFKPLPEQEVRSEKTRASMFQHLETGNNIQIVWRKLQVFAGMFPFKIPNRVQ